MESEEHDRPTGRLLYETDMDPEEEPSVAVVEAIAKVEECSANDLPERLFTVTDPDALDQVLVDPANAGMATVEFEFCGYRVTLTRDGTLRVATVP
ncbi:HalOD1 output domain-containing protein [Halomarina litorea]|uniref:HalOD1 output domain-containing protein n=1 Tax=Halomarina litorea TaxID=2961595 RepID=UPI0020C2CD59|nr:HalOD1 output domain-containing protein [Halomarina sp. BCD28]